MKIIMFKEKHSNRYFAFAEDELLKKIFLKILKERIKEGYFRDDYLHSKTANLLVKEGMEVNIHQLKAFFQNRCDYEYEYFEIVDLEIVE